MPGLVLLLLLGQPGARELQRSDLFGLSEDSRAVGGGRGNVRCPKSGYSIAQYDRARQRPGDGRREEQQHGHVGNGVDDDAFYLFLQKQKIALKPYYPPLVILLITHTPHRAWHPSQWNGGVRMGATDI
jgi:hypothetical protein